MENPQITRKPRSFPWLWLAVLAVVIGGAAYFKPMLTGSEGGGHAGGPPGGAMPASVAMVVVKPVAPWSEFSGQFEAVSSAEIRPQVSGQITDVHFEDGAEVKKGQRLFTIDPRPYEAEVLRAKGALASAQAGFENAELDFKRAQALIEAKAISQSEFEGRQSAYAQAKGALEAARGALTVAQVNLDYAHVSAPISGRISRAEIKQGNLVQAGASAPLLATIVAASPIYASFEVDERTFLATIQGVPTDKLKQIPVEVGLSNSTGTPIKGQIHSFDNQLTPGSGTIRVRALVENADGTLVPGLFARVRMSRPEEVTAVLIHPAAIGTDQNKKFVLAIDKDSKAEYREVTLGSMVDGLQIVSHGLNEGDRIVVSGLQRLHPGVPVQPMMVDMQTLKPADTAPAAPKAEGAAVPAKSDIVSVVEEKKEVPPPAPANAEAVPVQEKKEAPVAAPEVKADVPPPVPTKTIAPSKSE